MKTMSIIGVLLSILGIYASVIITMAGECNYLNHSLSIQDTQNIGVLLSLINIFLLIFSIITFIKYKKN